ncbi:hypothetical protein N7494_000594 [Penicillium frequentans]|uniref:Uncharacterized protein n=1 Tax=Penicillium frequentans TaxID=3151616 RepID=A0AAD6D6H6_9EURO|nr:hypothetical protein N7494_000594 [Penicillium glabrum]
MAITLTEKFEKAEIEKAPESWEELPPDPDGQLDDRDKKRIDGRLVRKLDMRLLPWLSLLTLAGFFGPNKHGKRKD